MSRDEIMQLRAGIDAYRVVTGIREYDQSALDFASNGLRRALAEVERLRAEITNAKAFVYNITPGTSATTIEVDQKDTLDEQIESLRVRQKAAVERLRAGLRLCIGQHTGRVWSTVPDADVDSYVIAAEAAGGK